MDEDQKPNPYGPAFRIMMRYVIGIVAAQGIIPAALADYLNSSPEAMQALQVAICGVAAGFVEWAYRVAKKRGWTL